MEEKQHWKKKRMKKMMTCETCFGRVYFCCSMRLSTSWIGVMHSKQIECIHPFVAVEWIVERVDERLNSSLVKKMKWSKESPLAESIKQSINQYLSAPSFSQRSGSLLLSSVLIERINEYRVLINTRYR